MERTYGERVTSMEVFLKRNCIQGYHIYKEVCEVAIGEALACESIDNIPSPKESPKMHQIDTLWL